MENLDLDLQGWMFEAEQRWLYETAYSLPDAATIVEIGSWKGLSTSNLCKGCKNSGKKVYAVDTWKGTADLLEIYYIEAKSKDIYNIFQNNMRLLGYSEIVVPLQGESVEIANGFKPEIDFLFIDGDHAEASLRQDLTAWLPHCKETAVVAGHDFAHWAPGVMRLIDELFSIYLVPADSIWRSSVRYYREKAMNVNKHSTDRLKFTFIIMAYNFGHRLKLCLESLLLQTFPLNRFEVLIGNPQSPDKLPEIMRHFNKNHPDLSLSAIDFSPSVGMDRGRIYNELAWRAKGNTLILMDADAILPPEALQSIATAVEQFPRRYYSCYRRDVPTSLVNKYIFGEVNLKEHIGMLQSIARPAQASNWAAFAGKIGFLQIVNRDVFLKVRYAEGHRSVAETDIDFADRYIQFVGDTRDDFRIPSLEVFHLDHRRSWEGVAETQ